MGRAADALKDLANPAVGDYFDAPLWRALAYADLGKWPQARQGFNNVAAAIATVPIELQRVVTRAALHAAIEMRDFAEAGNLLETLETGGRPADASALVLKGRLAEGLGRIADALASYEAAAVSADRPAAAQGRLRAVVLKSTLGRIKRGDAINELEGLTTAWRGDTTEYEAQQLLGRLYAEDGRYRDALTAMRTALTGHADSEIVRRAQDEAAALFDALFLGGKADALPPVEALSLFYDFRDLTPVGRRGDEMIRRLADRLVSVDLLDQAAALLQHQVDHRLQGAARAQIATRLAVIYLLGRKPDHALQTLQASRTADLPNELRNQRLLLEARALSDTGRHDLALEVVANLQGRDVDRLRADVLWAGRRWREAGEQIEKLYGERWREFAALSESERADILRAALAYSLADDMIGIERFRQKYAAKMGEGPDKTAFAVAIDRKAVDSAEFAEIAKKISAVDTLDGFLRDLRVPYPQAGPASATPPAAGERPS
jgi:Tfp pilus assembly protein PilF